LLEKKKARLPGLFSLSAGLNWSKFASQPTLPSGLRGTDVRGLITLGTGGHVERDLLVFLE
jgi:hypothetical protein